MYTVFIVFVSGHTIKLTEMHYLDNAIIEADYHAKHTKDINCHFEVCKNGNIYYTSNN